MGVLGGNLAAGGSKYEKEGVQVMDCGVLGADFLFVGSFINKLGGFLYFEVLIIFYG